MIARKARRSAGSHTGTMHSHLTVGQRAWLESLLRQRQSQLDGRLAQTLQGGGRADHARDVLLQDGDDAPQREESREVDFALTDQQMQELGAVSRALARVHDEGYGVCGDCGREIPFDRLKIEPWAERCVACQGAAERR